MEDQLFREKSMEQLSTPEQLTSYLRVTGFGVWVVLAGIILLLAGLLIWGVFGRIVTRVTVPVQVENGVASCYVLTEDLDKEDHQVDISIGDVKMDADTGEAKEIILDASADPALYESGYLSPGKNAKILTCDTDLQDGIYEAAVTTETLKPITVLFGEEA